MYRPSKRLGWGRTAIVWSLSAVLAFPVSGIAFAEDSGTEGTESSQTTEQSETSQSIREAQERSEEATKKREQLQQQLATAKQTLANLGTAAEVAEYELLTVTTELNKTIAHIEELDAQIPETEAQLGTARDDLAKMVADTYKSGTPTLLDVIVDSADFDDLVSHIEYANRVSEYKSGVVNEVKGLNEQLNQQRTDLEVERVNQQELVTQQEERVAAVEAAANQAQEYYASLSGELQQMLAEEQAAQQRAAQEAAHDQAAAAQQRAAQEAAAAQQQQQQQQQQAQQQQTQQQQQQTHDPSSENTNQPAEEEQSTSTPEETPDPAEQTTQSTEQTPQYTEEYTEPQETYEDTSSYSTGYSFDTTYSSTWISGLPSTSGTTSSSKTVNEFVTRAFSIIGASYQWSGYTWTGNPFSSAFTCSGVVDFARGLPSRSSSPETLMAEVGSRMVYSTSELKYGDLVFYACLGRAPGHVAIYIGNGQIIDSIPNGGVAVRDVEYMTPMGGGPIY